MKNRTILRLSALSLLTVAALASLSGCAAIGIGIGTLTGVSAAKEGGISGAVSDAGIQARINDLWFKYSTEAFAKLDMTVKNGRVLLTGVVQNPDHRVEAVRLAWQPKGVKQVINEIRVAESEGIRGYARDQWITTRLRFGLVRAREVQSLNYTIDTVQGIIYLMGVAQSQAELDKVFEIARVIPNVKQVVSYVRVKTLEHDPLRDMDAPEQSSKPVSNGSQSDTENDDVKGMDLNAARPSVLVPPVEELPQPQTSQEASS